MRRSLVSLGALVLAAGAMGQANFNIVRPADGAHVREKIHVLFPKGSIPPGGYIGVFFKGQLIDALVPPTHGKYQEYVLDTKARGIPDSAPDKPDRLEVKLYVDYDEHPRIVKTSSVDLYIGNEANIQIPPQGVLLRYKFTPGTQMIYDLDQKVAIDTISESDNAKQGKPAELPLDAEKIRLLYAVDNAYGNGNGLIRMQALPEPGKKYATLTTIQSGQPQVFFDYMMSSIYMELSPTGHEIFGSVPLYYPLEGTAGEGSQTDLFADYPLPTLPETPVKPGTPWRSRFQEAKLDLNNLYNQDSLVQHFPARGEFVNVEWERGHPCARIRNTIETSTLSDEDKKLLKKGSSFGGDKIQVSEDIWFAMDIHKVLKIDRHLTIETKTQAASTGGMGMGMGAPGMGGMPGAPGGKRLPGGAGGFGPSQMKTTTGKALMQVGPTGFGRGGQRPPGFPGGRGGGFPPGVPMGPMGPGRMGGPGQFPGASRGNQQVGPAESEYVRLTLEQVFTLEL
ncbi:MAG TPA: hypothetical protein VG944_24445 [Fimbriimonas sp.]|nr:hypothetical protein [Fimbriimonas sp.]